MNCVSLQNFRPAVRLPALICYVSVLSGSGVPSAFGETSQKRMNASELSGYLVSWSRSAGICQDLSGEAAVFLRGITSAFQQNRPVLTKTKKDGMEISIPVQEASEFRIFGKVASTSHFPYDFSWYPDQKKQYRLKISAHSGSITFRFYDQLHAHYFLEKFGDDQEAADQAYQDFIGNFRMFVRFAHRQTIVHGLESAAGDPDLAFRSMKFFKEAGNSEVRVSAKLVSYKNKQEALEILLDKLPYLEYARSAVSFGAMILSHYFPHQVPKASARLINRLFSQRTGNGKGKDGRTDWSVTHR